jgi:hypothetical protein
LRVPGFFDVMADEADRLPFDLPIPTGLEALSRGCEERATPGKQIKGITTLKGLNRVLTKLLFNPFRVAVMGGDYPR